MVFLGFKKRRTVRHTLLSSAFVVGALSAAVMLSGCDMNEPTFYSQQRAQLEVQEKTLALDTASIGSHEARALGDHYGHYGQGSMGIVVTYDPQSRTNTAMHASRELARVKKELKAYGVHDVNGRIMPVKALGDESVTHISYDYGRALAPKDCNEMPGADGLGSDAVAVKDYKMGCTVETYFAKQIAHPSDMYGRDDNTDTFDGRRNAPIVESYRTGEGPGDLSGDSASGN